ncbi:LysR family transcriptional regulator [Hafnia psychrotolerans]|uniref:LysR family transcriptional regulator n=1 Tax=Hafnia psychrotolerans TaxID=1477018 RepID=A0ABQ1G1B9_9GAMM|nr:LysR family transcriptional regulator [Hafnia psychrotolerans]GGA35522.1 LysR family transcriptional regulator [Hafnia psychrotolerans]
MGVPQTTLEQWFVLQTVIEKGGYAQAALHLHRSQSSVSYALSSLQERLGLPLLEIAGRRAVLTEQGQALLAQARPLIMAFIQLEQRAAGLTNGERTQLSLVVDSVFPKRQLFSALKIFQQQFPQTQVHLTEILRTEDARQLSERAADVYITTLAPENALSGHWLLDVDFIPVASSKHPLLQLSASLSGADLARFPLITIADRDAPRREKQRLDAASSWTFTTVEAAVDAISVGVGYGWMPLERVRSALDNGVLCRLPLAAKTVRQTPLYLRFGAGSNTIDHTVSTLAQIVMQEIAATSQ